MGKFQIPHHITIYVLLIMKIAGSAHGSPSVGNPVHSVRRLLGSKPTTYMPPATIGKNTVVGHSVTPSFDSVKKDSVSPSSVANLGHRVSCLLDSLERAPLPPSAPNPPTSSPSAPATELGGCIVARSLNSVRNNSPRPSSPTNLGHGVRHQQGSLERAPVPPSAPDPVTYIPGRPLKAGADNVSP